MKKNYFFYYLLLFCSFSVCSQTINFTIDTAIDTGTTITETISIGADTYVLTIDHSIDIETLDDLGGGDLIFYLGTNTNATAPFLLDITLNGTPVNFKLNGIDYDTLATGSISVLNQDDEIISPNTSYPVGAGAITITNISNAANITAIKILPATTNELVNFGFHNISVDILNTLSTDEVITLDTEVEIYPNPSNGNITIKNPGITLDQVQISDLNGRIVYSQDLNGITEDQELVLSSILSSGVYLMTLESDKASTVKKLIIE